MVAGAGDPLPSSSLFVHGDSPCLGEMWSAQGSIAFDKFKLTNNRCTIIQGQTCLHSMHKYLPKVLVVPLSTDQIHMSSETLLRHFEEFGVPSNADEFVFPETAFITVTAYQNQQVSFRFRLSKYFLKTSTHNFSCQNNAWVVWTTSFRFCLPKYFLESAHTIFRVQVRFSKIDQLKAILRHKKTMATSLCFLRQLSSLWLLIKTNRSAVSVSALFRNISLNLRAHIFSRQNNTFKLGLTEHDQH